MNFNIFWSPDRYTNTQLNLCIGILFGPYRLYVVGRFNDNMLINRDGWKTEQGTTLGCHWRRI